MKEKMKNYLTNQKYKKMIGNFSYLSLINITNKIIPLIVVPYIVRTIGIEKFGIISFALVIVMYFQLISQYSFQLTATKYISLHRDNIEKVSKHFWIVLVTRVLLSIVIFIIFIVLVFSIDMFYQEKEVFLFTFFLVFADVLMPLWFFRGIEEMKYIAIFNIIAKLLYAINIFIFLNTETDYILIPLFNSLTLFIVGLYSLYFSISKFNILFIIPNSKAIFQELKYGKDIFYSTISISFYTTLNTVLLGFLTNYTTVGIYTLAEALFNAYTSIIKSYTHVIYPHLARYTQETQKLLLQVRKFFILYLFILIIASLFLFTISSFIITLLYGKGHDESILILQILSIALLFSPFGGFFTAYLSIKSDYKTIRNITFKTMIINLIAVLPMIFIFEAKGIAYLFLLVSVVQIYLNLSYNREILYIRSKK